MLWKPEADTAFSAIKEALAKATLLLHPQPGAPLSVMTNASETAVRAVLQHSIENVWKPFAYFSHKLKPSQTHYSTFDKELLAIYLALQRLLEGQNFHILTDHKPLTFSLYCNPHRYSPRQVRHLDYISQFTSDIWHVKGTDNSVADALSRINIQAIQSIPPTIDFATMAQVQSDC